MKRKHISWKTKCAAAVLNAMMERGRELDWYLVAKDMTEDQFLSLFQWDHNIFHSATRGVARPEGGLEFTPIDPDVFWNLTPMLIKAHREKTRADAKIIAKGRRIRAWNEPFMNAAARAPKLRTGPGETAASARGAIAEASRPARTRRKLRSRGFDKTKRRKMDGTVVKR
jgi:hypothetical protein